MEQLILALLIWLGAHTEYNTAVSLPQIEYKTMREMSDMMYGDTPLENRSEILAVYSMKPSTLFLGHGFDITNKQHQALLVHELTHHLQNKNNITFPCSQLYEPEAYEMMKIWSLKNKISYEGPSDFTIMARFGQCPDE